MVEAGGLEQRVQGFQVILLLRAAGDKGAAAGIAQHAGDVVLYNRMGGGWLLQSSMGGEWGCVRAHDTLKCAMRAGVRACCETWAGSDG